MTDPGNELSLLPDDVRWSLEKCDGYLDLEMIDRARQAFASIPESHRASEPCRRAALRLAMSGREWARAAEWARGLRDEHPDRAGYWIQLAYAERRARGLDTARPILQEALRLFPKEALIAFNLGCYECQLGNLAEARKLVNAAIEISPHCRDMAIEDPDLEPLWHELSE
jgi:lipopolysaccharide biosynthesis regulator YciM